MKGKLTQWLAMLQKHVQLRKRLSSVNNRQVLSGLGKIRVRNPVKSVGMKLFLIFFVSIVLFVLGVGTASFQMSKGIIKEKVSDASYQTIIQASEKMDLLYQTYESVFNQISNDMRVQSLIGDLSDKTYSDGQRFSFSQTLSTIFNNILFSNTGLSAIHLLPINEGDIGVSTSGMQSSNYKSQRWFKNIVDADGKLYWMETRLQGYYASEQTYGLARLLKDKSKKPAFVLFIEVKARTLANAVKLINLGNGGEVTVTDANNVTVFSAKMDTIELEYPVNMKPFFKESDSGKKLVAQENGERLIVYHQSKVNNWFTIGSLPSGELVKEANKISNLTWWMTILAMIVAGLIGYFVVRMMRPLIELSNLMKEGERGNLSVRANFNSRDEIGQLGNSFNEMMENITLLVRQTNQSAHEVLATSAELSDASKKTALSAKEIAVATEEIAKGASSLAVEAERGNEITQQIGVQMDNVVTANRDMEMAAAEVHKASEQGAGYMTELTDKTNVTEQMTRSMIEKVDKLKESTSSIRKILDVLNGITKQTNILSLNATIEAARAGAAGKGFMVVADEIRKLADQSRQSIDVVAEITDKIQTEIDETVSVLSEAYPIFQEQISSVKEADAIFKQVQEHMNGFVSKLSIATQSIDQLSESQQVLSGAMSNVSAVAEESSATSQEVASLSSEQNSVSEGLVKLAENLEQLSNSLKESLTRFKT